MTEAEAYKVNGWPLEGGGFILRCLNDGQDWTPYVCATDRSYRGIVVTRLLDDTLAQPCVHCGGRVEVNDNRRES